MNKPGAEIPLVTDLLVTSSSSRGMLGANLLGWAERAAVFLDLLSRENRGRGVLPRTAELS